MRDQNSLYNIIVVEERGLVCQLLAGTVPASRLLPQTQYVLHPVFDIRFGNPYTRTPHCSILKKEEIIQSSLYIIRGGDGKKMKKAETYTRIKKDKNLQREKLNILR